MKRIINSSRRSKQLLVLTLVLTAAIVTFLWPSTKATAANSATISGQVFNDKNGNAVKEAGESGLTGWTVQVLDTNNQVLAAQTTDANGNYSITLPPVPVGSITVKVREVVQAGWVQTTSNPADIVVTSTGGTFSGRDFGNFQKISISGQAFIDMNGNGSRDAGDPNLQGRTVFLDTNSSGAFDNGEPFTATDAQGNYSFTNLGPGTYKVRIVVPAGSLQTTGNPADITAVSGTNVDGNINSGLNFGNFQRISISGQVYNDLNGSGFPSAGEPGVVGWTVFLDTNGNGALDNGEPSAVTDPQGNYSFTNLGPGRYKVREVVQIGWTHTSANPSDIVASNGLNIDPTSNQGLNFGNFQNVSVSGKIFEDTNANGVLDAGEPGLSGWTVALGSNNVQFSTVTDSQGNYSFTNLGPGGIGVLGEFRIGWTRTHTQQLFIPLSGSNTVLNLGEFKNLTFNGTVYIDQNGNGVRDAGDLPQSGVTVQLFNTSGQLRAFIKTAADGSYDFGNSFGPGSYRIREVVPAGWLQTTSNPQDITLVFSGEAFIGRDFGNFQTISISGQVYNDLNMNGAIDTGDQGLVGWTVFLDANNNSTLDNGEPSVVTNSQGVYTFASVGPGTYRVREQLPAGWTQTTATFVTVAARSGTNVDATTNPGLNLGNFLTATVSGNVFDDTNANTTLDPGEPGLPGFTVYIDRNANGILDAGERTTSTDANGNYHFDFFPPQSIPFGNTVLQVKSPSGWSASYHLSLITVVSGSNIIANLGQFKFGSVNGTVYNDHNGNGSRDAGEPGLGGSTVQLINNADQVIASQITAADGSYTLSIQTRGTYRVREVVQTGFTQTTANPADIVATSGMNQSGVDFGITQPASIQFSQPNYTVTERGGSIQIAVTRTGETSVAASVDFATDDGSIPTVATPCSTVSGKASERCDYTRSAGTLSFAPGETQKSFIVLVNDDSYAEGAETLQLVLSNPAGGVLGQQSTATLQITDDSPESSGNPLDDPSFFIRQLYHDFLNREPDQSGLDFWTGNIISCGSDDDCRNVHRIHDSAAFFLSIEFQETGYLVERLYKVAYGDATGNSNFGPPHTLPVPVVRLREFLRDTQEIGQGVVVGASGWEQLLETNKQAFCAGFVSRQRFTDAFPLSLNAQQFVTQLDHNAGQVLTDTDKTQLMGFFGGASASSNDATKRALVLRQVADNSVLQQREFNRAFVLMQFFGYLRRNPDDAQDTDHSGFDFWLTKLNQFNGDFVQAEMVKAFITSGEYHQRFGP